MLSAVSQLSETSLTSPTAQVLFFTYGFKTLHSGCNNPSFKGCSADLSDASADAIICVPADIYS